MTCIHEEVVLLLDDNVHVFLMNIRIVSAGMRKSASNTMCELNHGLVQKLCKLITTNFKKDFISKLDILFSVIIRNMIV